MYLTITCSESCIAMYIAAAFLIGIIISLRKVQVKVQNIEMVMQLCHPI